MESPKFLVFKKSEAETIERKISGNNKDSCPALERGEDEKCLESFL